MNASPLRRAAAHERAAGLPDELVGRALAGDRGAVEAVIARIRPLVERYVRARLRRAEMSSIDVDDVVQEVCLAVLTELPRHRTQGRPVLAIVYGIAARKVTEAHRAFAHDLRAPVPDVPDRADVDGPEQHVLRADLAEELAHLVGTLPRHQREVLVLRVLVGLSAEETAEAVGSTPGAVRVAQHRALAQLRARITEGSAPPDVVELLADLDEEPLRRGHRAYVEALGSVLDLDAGLAHLEDRHRHGGFVAGLAGRLNLDAGLEALLRDRETRDP